ncbi:heme/hemin ABC transporter substrate-binding protein [Paracoccus aminophilus]|uniref:Hemin-binding periplasmic protein HmuT n=1 Tax=Paracoccus aminophilus JCM 7686 TaxID=1367847 RepID=S5XS43_PARAH|nr:ABC transporter substrate-binding protein [Paracoccus aminophilus]AGT10274.1 hemin-binding periplasmic protein HmuT [Paracoccus aminophilus JCM 7686]
MIRAALAAFLIAAPVAPAFAEGHPEAKKVLSIGGSITEIIYALGEEGRLVARDTTSSFPPEAEKLPDVGYVRALSPEGVLSVGPDLIIADQGAGPPEAVSVIKGAGIPYVEVPDTLTAEGIALKVTTVADALGVPEKGAALSGKITEDLAAVAADFSKIEKPKKVLFILSLQGGRIMAGGEGSSADAIIRLAGGENALTGISGYKPITDEAITQAQPDVVLMMNRGEPKADAAANGSADHEIAKAATLDLPAIQTTPAGKNNAVIYMDGLKLLGFGPRTAGAARELHDALYKAP